MYVYIASFAMEYISEENQEVWNFERIFESYWEQSREENFYSNRIISLLRAIYWNARVF